MLRHLLLLTMTASLVMSIPNTCLWCVSQGMTWTPGTSSCTASGGSIADPVSCFSQGQSSNLVYSFTYYPSTDIGALSPAVGTIPAAASNREITVTFANERSDALTFSLVCTGGVSKTYAMAGSSISTVALVSFPCGGTFESAPNSVGGVTVIANSGDAQFTLSVALSPEKGLSTGAIVGIVVGGLVLLGGVIVGGVCFLKKKRSQNGMTENLR